MYYDFTQLLSHKRPYSVCVGVRSVGKTYRFTKYGIKLGLEQKCKAFVWIRRYQDDIDELKQTFFDDMIANDEFPEWRFDCVAKQLMATNKETGERFCIGEFLALSQAQRAKSSPRPTVKIIVFDEFMSESEKYLTNEVLSFYSIVYSVFRTERQVRVFMLANAVSVINPYFSEWGIRSIDKQFTVTDNVVIENCDGGEFQEQAHNSSFGKSVVGSRYSEFALDNKFLLDDLTGIDKKPSGESYIYCNLKLHNLMIGVSAVNGLWYFEKAKDLQQRCYTVYVDDAQSGGSIFLEKTNWQLIRYLANQFASGYTLFESLEIKNEIILMARLIIKNF